MVTIGSSALAIYIAARVVNFKGIVEPIVGGPVADAVGPYRELFLNAAANPRRNNLLAVLAQEEHLHSHLAVLSCTELVRSL